jgi:hypothetical protein
MHRVLWRRFGWGAAAGALTPAIVVAGTMDRLKSVSQHARKQVEGGPDHLWMGIGIFAILAVVVALAAWWTLSKRTR